MTNLPRLRGAALSCSDPWVIHRRATASIRNLLVGPIGLRIATVITGTARSLVDIFRPVTNIAVATCSTHIRNRVHVIVQPRLTALVSVIPAAPATGSAGLCHNRFRLPLTTALAIVTLKAASARHLAADISVSGADGSGATK